MKTDARKSSGRVVDAILSAVLAVSVGWSVPTTGIAGNDAVQIVARLSQGKLVQNSHNTVYLDVTLLPSPMSERTYYRRSTDLLIVLDRSGSMSEARKMPFARAAIRDVLERLDDNDRFALIVFSDRADVAAHWMNVNPSNRRHLNRLVDSIVASGGTNMGEGLQNALQLLTYGDNERARKILLLSDGQANQGIIHPDSLARMAARATEYGAVLSTIGMGLGFNESLLAKLADHGMGHYSYLEDLSGLTAILNRDLKDARQLFASRSSLEIRLGKGVQLIDAGGYPLSQEEAAVTIVTGQLLSNTPKHFVMTFKVPNARTGTISLGDIRLRYRVDGRDLGAVLDRPLSLTIVAPERGEEARKSIDQDVYKKSWLENNLGRAQKQLGRWLREGEREKAERVIRDYRQQLQQAEKEHAVPLASPAVEAELRQMREQVEEAFTGSVQERQRKQNRAAKSLQYEALKKQRQ